MTKTKPTSTKHSQAIPSLRAGCRRLVRPLSSALCLLLLVACQLAPQPSALRRPSSVPRLLHHPQFPAARAAAPDWAKDALTTINDLELRVADLEANSK